MRKRETESNTKRKVFERGVELERQLGFVAEHVGMRFTAKLCDSLFDLVLIGKLGEVRVKRRVFNAWETRSMIKRLRQHEYMIYKS